MGNDDHVLIAEDSEDDLFLLRRAFQKAGMTNPVHEVRDGVQAIQYLGGQGKYSDRQCYPLPCLIITDLKMPNMDGFELLRWLHGRVEFHRVPKLVLSSSDVESDRKQAAQLGVCAFFVKPNEFDKLVKVVAEMDDDWISLHCPLSDPAVSTKK